MDRHVFAERFVASAKLRFTDFRVDFEKVSNAASKAAREGNEDLTHDDAFAFFTDADWVLRIPLQHRYAAEGKLEEIAYYHAKRFKLYLGRNLPWPDEPAKQALELFVAHGRPDIGVGLVRTYVEMQHKRLKRDYSSRNPRGPRVDRPEEVQQTIAAIGKLIAAGIPAMKAGLLHDLDILAPYVEAHGTAGDRDWLEKERRAIWMEKRA